MKLKKISIQGFKSFADKTDINVKDGVTGIVGPNGSGKSNISDAIRWVLGEQSVKNLRGLKMEDVIFAGTEKRKPLGYAEVTIVFDNESGKIPLEYREIAVTRRMFRSGESEYYINKNSCRLKDVREIFMDTGIGKDGYSIIGQGRIDEVLSNRPEDRRSIFEEAAGIVKYKTKKQEAERRLGKTEENFNRIKDLIYELENREGSLKNQAEEAKLYKEYYSELKQKELAVFYSDMDGLDKKIEVSKLEKLEAEENYELDLHKKEEISKEFHTMKVNLDRYREELAKFQLEKDEISKEIDGINNEISILKERENYGNVEFERYNSEEKELVKNIGATEEEIVKLSSQIDDLEEKLEGEVKIYDELGLKVEEKLREIKSLDERMSSEKDNLILIYNELSDLKSEANSIRSFKSNISDRYERVKKELAISDEELKKLDLESSSGNLEIEKQVVEKDRLLKEIQVKKDENFKLSSELEGLSQAINTCKNELNKQTSNLSVLNNMEEAHEGYYKGVKEVLKVAKTKDEIRKSLLGVVADLFKVEDMYELAIETALGSNVQNLVTRDEESSKTIIDYLKANSLGRVTCLPLNVISGNTIDIKDLDREKFGIYGLGSDLIDYDKTYEGIFLSLLGRTIVVKDMDYGIKLSRHTKQKHRIVTLDGAVLNAGGSITGGSRIGGNTGLIGRKNRIEELEKGVEDFKLELENLNSEFEVKSDSLKLANGEILKLEDEIKRLDYELVKLNKNMEVFLQEKNRMNLKVQRETEELKTLEEDIKKQDRSLADLELKLKAKEDEKENKNYEIELLTEKSAGVKLENEEELKEHTEFKIKLNSERNGLENLEKDVELKRGQIKNQEAKIEKLKLEKENTLEILEDYKKNILEKDTSLREKVEILAGITEKIREFTAENENLLNDFYKKQEELNEITEIESKDRDILNNLDLDIERFNMQIGNILKRMLEEYEIEIDLERLTIICEYFEHDIDGYKKDTQRLKRELKKLGNVNLASIEEYDLVSDRLEFMIEQREDLESAKKDLYKVITDMEKKMKIQFEECFHVINENFKKIFTILFDGGEAKLILENPDDILNSGIDVKAQPPGKKQQNLSLLSGGERSLTAVALLFAMLEMRPSPFCILDEIDAALDEANIGRYTKYLSEFREEIQFVMITHRKTTMEMADVLYGVTMEEEGVSKILSVELSEKEKLEEMVG